ncbi:hypothetical protein GN244_ATG19974 [Phytophthora infestans]|uniref:Uncharacterized protein n=1 Tax=Phytophthora infestans TaxID=4787 RepID=A0A833WCI0_PHYIN|nr:hypothetical protein GN244_ATG19974 [Phytophthora infestans]
MKASEVSDWIGHSLLRIKYKITPYESVDHVTKRWMQETNSRGQIYDRWKELGKSDKEASTILLRNGESQRGLYDVLKSRFRNKEEMEKLWRDLNLDMDA